MTIKGKTFSIISRLLPFKIIALNSNPIFLYHAVFDRMPKNIQDGLHNVTPEILFEQLSYIKKHYEIISVDDYLELRDKNGYACITFDDGYKSVLDYGLPVIESLNLPITIFLNTSSFEGKAFWRDKVRFIINNNLVEEFKNFATTLIRANGQDFYNYTKNKNNNSIIVENEINKFIEYKNINSNQLSHLFDSKRCLINHPLISYGNHSHNHYVMSSLSFDEQFQEISNAKKFLINSGINHSKVFSLPFGRMDDFNDDTINILENEGYDAMLMSQNLFNFPFSTYKTNGNIILLERFMTKNKLLPATMKEIFLRTIIDKIMF